LTFEVVGGEAGLVESVSCSIVHPFVIVQPQDSPQLAQL
jgi:hypothetical protein